MAKMRKLPINDFFGQGRQAAHRRPRHPRHVSLRGEDARGIEGPWDYYKLIRTIPGDEAYRPLDKGGCPLVK